MAFITNSPHAPRIPHNYTELTKEHSNDGYQTTGLDDPGFPTRQRQEISLFFKPSTASLGPIKPPIRWVKRPGREVLPLTPHPVPKFTMSGATPLPPLYGFMVWAGATWLSLNTRLFSYKGVRRWGSIIMKTFFVWLLCVYVTWKRSSEISNKPYVLLRFTQQWM